MKLDREVREGGIQGKIPYVGDVWIVFGTTHFSGTCLTESCSFWYG